MDRKRKISSVTKPSKRQKLLDTTRDELNAEKQELKNQGFNKNTRVLRDKYLVTTDDNGNSTCTCGYIFTKNACGESQIFNHITKG